MKSDGSSVLRWIAHLKRGDADAARQLWERYSARMQRLARARLRNRPHAGFDEEDVTVSAFDAFCRAVHEGKYFNQNDPTNLWALLATFTVRKLNDELKSEGAAKRTGPTVPANTDADRLDVNQIPSSLEGPVSNAMMADEYRRLFSALGDATLEQVAVLKLEGHTNAEIADQLGYTRRTIQRMLNLIRSIWSSEEGVSDRGSESE